MARSVATALQRHKQAWEELANLDPYWSIITAEGCQHGKWDLKEFLQTGEQAVQRVMEGLPALGYPREREAMLDFGCGVGRLTRVFSRHFQRATGVDISQRMVDLAHDLNQAMGNCEFLLNTESHLGLLRDNQFDLVYSDLVLQHIPNRRIIEAYISEFMRVVKPSGLVIFQLPHHVRLRNRLQPRRRIYGLLRRLGVSERILYENLKLHPICANFVPQARVLALLKSNHGKLVKLQTEPDFAVSVESSVYFVTK